MAPHDVLILSYPDDVHYQAVDWALRRIGLSTALLFGNCFPQDDVQTLLIDDEGVSYERDGPAGERLDLLSATVVWNRRATWPIVSPDLSPVDQRAAAREAEMFVDGARSIAASTQRWINPPDRELVASRKPYQLDVARRLGFRIPRTLMSNDPERIRRFFEEASADVLMKPFHPMQWKQGEEEYLQFASKLDFADIPDPSDLRFTSQIFQEYVDKSYELRVFWFGGRILAFKLHSQESEQTRTDWRVSTDGSLRPEPYALPERVEEAIARYMGHMGLEYGALDFIVDRSGDYVFLECNVAGQFLFLESWNPEIPILADFVRFLTAGLDLPEERRLAIDGLRYADFRRDAEAAAHYRALRDSYSRTSVTRNLHPEPGDAAAD